jgi:outer membrane immunogenic protein
LVTVRHCWAVILSFVATLVFAETVSAADLPGAPVNPPGVIAAPDWSGFYLGVEGGDGFGNSRKNFSAGTSTGDFKIDGAIGGGTVGYDKQWGNIVAGLEGDFSWSGVDGRTSCPNRAATCETNTTWLATVRPRIGYALGNFMPYVTGGLAAGNVNVKSFFNSTGVEGVDFTKTQPGWTAGAGVELSIYANWSLKAEYLYVQFAKANGPSDNPPTTSTTNFNENIIRGGLNYSFK